MGRSREAAALGCRAFSRREVSKVYSAIVEGIVDPTRFPLANPLTDAVQLASVKSTITPVPSHQLPKQQKGNNMQPVEVHPTTPDLKQPSVPVTSEEPGVLAAPLSTIVKLNLLHDEDNVVDREKVCRIQKIGDKSDDSDNWSIVVTHSIADVEEEFRMEVGHPNNPGKIARTEIEIVEYCWYQVRYIQRMHFSINYQH